MTTGDGAGVFHSSNNFPRRRLLLFAGILALAFYSEEVLRQFLAAQWGAQPTVRSLTRAIRVDPAAAELQFKLGIVYFYGEQNATAAVPYLHRATSLNPYNGRFWLQLANTYQVLGDEVRQRQAMQRALQAEPTTPLIAWTAANYELLAGNIDPALRHLQVAAANDPSLLPRAIELAWRTTRSVDRVDKEVLGDSARTHLAFLNHLVQTEEYESADKEWGKLSTLGQPFDPKLAFPYFNSLQQRHQVAALRKAWEMLARLSPGLSEYRPAGNLINNGSFEEPILDGGLDWRTRPEPGMQVELDSSVFKDGSRSLAFTFSDSMTDNLGIVQYVPVQPGQSYRVTMTVRGERLESASMPRIQIRDAYTDEVCAISEPLLISDLWQERSADFKTGPKTELVILEWVRKPADRIIRGKLWVDDVLMEQQ